MVDFIVAVDVPSTFRPRVPFSAACFRLSAVTVLSSLPRVSNRIIRSLVRSVNRAWLGASLTCFHVLGSFVLVRHPTCDQQSKSRVTNFTALLCALTWYDAVAA